MQIAKSFDPETIAKIQKGLLISLGGALVAGLGVLGVDINSWLSDPSKALVIHWTVIGLTSLGAFCTSIVNITHQWLAGQPE
jgi:hypothetical protein